MSILLLLWSTILSTGYGADKYSQYTLIYYYISITFLGSFVGFDYHLTADSIRLGSLSSYLVKPINYYINIFVESLAYKLLILLIFFPIIITFIKLEFLGLTILTIFLAMIMRFLVVLIVGGLAFWFNRVHGFNAAIFTIGGLFSGEMIPTDLLPEKIQLVANLLPFKYWSFVPAKYLSGNLVGQDILGNLFMQLFWIIIGFMIVRTIWHYGLKKYESAGR